MKLPVVFAKKTEAANLDTDFLAASVYSFTRQREYTIRVSRKYLQPGDRVLVIDDFLANGQALLGLADIISQAGADFVGAGIVIEKAFQQGGELARERGIEVHSLAKIQDMTDGKVHFCDDHL
jgi:xanthine phosphoribosyltransferase